MKPYHFRPLASAAYEILSATDDTVAIGIDLHISESNDNSDLVWFDTTKERIKKIVKIIVDIYDLFVFASEDDTIYVVRPLSLEKFKTRIAPRYPNAGDVSNVTTESEMTKLLFQSMEGM